jgi:hypothetical protein
VPLNDICACLYACVLSVVSRRRSSAFPLRPFFAACKSCSSKRPLQSFISPHGSLAIPTETSSCGCSPRAYRRWDTAIMLGWSVGEGGVGGLAVCSLMVVVGGCFLCLLRTGVGKPGGLLVPVLRCHCHHAAHPHHPPAAAGDEPAPHGLLGMYAVGLLLPRCSSTSTMPHIQSRRGAGDMYSFLVLRVVLHVWLLPCRTRTLTE